MNFEEYTLFTPIFQSANWFSSQSSCQSNNFFFKKKIFFNALPFLCSQCVTLIVNIISCVIHFQIFWFVRSVLLMANIRTTWFESTTKIVFKHILWLRTRIVFFFTFVIYHLNTLGYHFKMLNEFWVLFFGLTLFLSVDSIGCVYLNWYDSFWVVFFLSKFNFR